MSAFFLVPYNRVNLLNSAQESFKRRGFINGKRFRLSCGELLLFSKVMLPETNNFYQIQSASIYCVGTLIYKGESFKSSLQLLLKDLVEGSLKFEALQGNFVVLYDNGVRVNLLTDQTGMYKLFSNRDRDFITTSFMAAASCLQEIRFNHIAVREQLLYGFVSAPDTLVEGIQDVSRGFNTSWLDNNILYPPRTLTQAASSKQKSIEMQVDGISTYMSNAAKLLQEFGGECGISGGCDSRLIYASVHAKCGKLNSAHSHCTSKIHQSELGIAKQICELNETPLQIIPTTYLPDCEGTLIDKTLKENVYYYDARNAENIGAMSLTHTRDYKNATANKNGLTFSGIGGEIYRDFYFTKSSWYTPKQWLETRIFANGVKQMLTKRDYDSTVEYIISKISKSIGHELNRKVNPIDTKDYFSKYRIPNALSNVVHANNQMSFYLAPFTESTLIACARPNYKMQDHLGGYEGLIIEQFDKRASLIKTSKGDYNLHNIPTRLKYKWMLQSWYPYFIWKARLKMTGKNQNSSIAYKKMLEKSRYFKQAVDYFKEAFPEISIIPIEEGLVPLNSFVFTVCAIYELHQLNNNMNL